MNRNATTSAEFLASFESPREGRFVFVRGSQRGTDPRLQRVGLIEFTGAPQTLADAWVPLTEAPQLQLDVRSRCRTTHDFGQWDVMSHGHWSWVWWFGPGTFEVWNRDERLWWVEPGPDIVSPTQRFSRLDLKCVTFSISEDRVVRTLAWELYDGTQIPLITVEDPQPLIDPTYDEHDLSFSIGWFPVLGRGLRRCLGVPFVMPEI